mgnify:CR=1 FL=1
MKSLQKGSKKLLNAWAFYDWANSVYSLTIASAIFPLFYGALFREAGIEKIKSGMTTIEEVLRATVEDM